MAPRKCNPGARGRKWKGKSEEVEGRDTESGQSPDKAERCRAGVTHISKLVVPEVGLVALEELHSQVAVQSVPLLQTETCLEPSPPKGANGATPRMGTYIELLQLIDGILGIQQLVSQLHNLPVQGLSIHLSLLDLQHRLVVKPARTPASPLPPPPPAQRHRPQVPGQPRQTADMTTDRRRLGVSPALQAAHEEPSEKNLMPWEPRAEADYPSFAGA